MNGMVFARREVARLTHKRTMQSPRIWIVVASLWLCSIATAMAACCQIETTTRSPTPGELASFARWLGTGAEPSSITVAKEGSVTIFGVEQNGQRRIRLIYVEDHDNTYAFIVNLRNIFFFSDVTITNCDHCSRIMFGDLLAIEAKLEVGPGVVAFVTDKDVRNRSSR